MADLLVSANGIARELHLADPSVVRHWIKRHPDFPQPVFAEGRVRVWYLPEVRAWARETGRMPATPDRRRTHGNPRTHEQQR